MSVHFRAWQSGLDGWGPYPYQKNVRCAPPKESPPPAILIICGTSGSAGSRKLRAQADQRFSPSLLKMRIAVFKLPRLAIGLRLNQLLWSGSRQRKGMLSALCLIARSWGGVVGLGNKHKHPFTHVV